MRPWLFDVENGKLNVLVAIALLILAFTAESGAQNVVYWTTNYYAVTGATIREIQRSLHHARPWKDTSGTDGQTAWRVDWTFNLTAAASSCRCAAFSTTTTIVVTLPRWNAPTNALPEARQAWERYSTALGKHEAGHVHFAFAAANEVHKRIGELGVQSDCDGLKQTINDVGQRVVDDFRRREKEYDRQTQHGATQGARFPPKESSQ